jgi:hypothetical protein
MEEKPKRGRPKNGHTVHSIRCSDEEYQLIKNYLRKLRENRKTEAEIMQDLEKQGQRKLKF